MRLRSALVDSTSPFTTPFSDAIKKCTETSFAVPSGFGDVANNWNEHATSSQCRTQCEFAQPFKFNFDIICDGFRSKVERIKTSHSTHNNLCKFNLREFKNLLSAEHSFLNHFATVHKLVMENYYLKDISFHGLLMIEDAGGDGGEVAGIKNLEFNDIRFFYSVFFLKKSLLHFHVFCYLKATTKLVAQIR